ncbi:MAG: pyrroline-5-carboxylate reductase [Acholeplasmatales bacterium]|nr:pyrroline-5-carboxylate reductase [Acholeplasmatales bacterium]
MSYKFGILGVGKMGSSILRGIIASGVFKKEDILLNLYTDEEVKTYGDEGFTYVKNDPKRVFELCDLTLLSVKPQVFPEVAKIADELDFNGKGIMSIMAGITISSIEVHFKNAKIIRVMPNTPALIKKAVATVCSKDISSIYYNQVFDILSSIGVAYPIDESKMDESLALNGSMPAYLELFAKAFIDQAVKDGIDYETAKKLTCQSIISSASLILKSDESIDQLITNVCSKGGTTIAGLEKLYEYKFEEAIYECSKACANRSRELSK